MGWGGVSLDFLALSRCLDGLMDHRSSQDVCAVASGTGLPKTGNGHVPSPAAPSDVVVAVKNSPQQKRGLEKLVAKLDEQTNPQAGKRSASLAPAARPSGARAKSRPASPQSKTRPSSPAAKGPSGSPKADKPPTSPARLSPKSHNNQPTTPTAANRAPTSGSRPPTPLGGKTLFAEAKHVQTCSAATSPTTSRATKQRPSAVPSAIVAPAVLSRILNSPQRRPTLLQAPSPCAAATSPSRRATTFQSPSPCATATSPSRRPTAFQSASPCATAKSPARLRAQCNANIDHDDHDHGPSPEGSEEAAPEESCGKGAPNGKEGVLPEGPKVVLRDGLSSVLVNKFHGVLAESKKSALETAQVTASALAVVACVVAVRNWQQAIEGGRREVEFTVSPSFVLTSEPSTLLQQTSSIWLGQNGVLGARQTTALVQISNSLLRASSHMLRQRTPADTLNGLDLVDIDMEDDFDGVAEDVEESQDDVPTTPCHPAPKKATAEVGRSKPCDRPWLHVPDDAAAKEENVLSMPLNECLTKASSCMLQAGLTFDLCNGKSASCKGKPTQEYRDGLRSAMWSTIINAFTRSMWRRHLRQRKIDDLVHLVAPLMRKNVWMRRRKAARQFLSALGRGKLGPLTPAKLQSTGNLFRDWPEEHLVSFSRKVRAQSFRYGEYICHQGDPSTTLFVLMAGRVSVVIRKPDSKSKCRGRSTGLTVATLQAPCVFGEYGVFADEPRSATLVCEGTVHTWACRKEVLMYHLATLPRPVFRDINSQFAASMARIYKVRPAQLQNSVLFQGWSTAILQGLVDKLVPVVFPPNAVILEAEKLGNCLYFLCSGRCEGVHAGNKSGDGQHRVVWGSGEQLGIRSVVFAEPQYYQVTALTTVQAWRLDKRELISCMLSQPGEFLAAKTRTNELFATFMERPPICQLKGCSPMFQQLPSQLVQRLWEAMQPRTLEPRATVVQEKEPVDRLLLVTAGACSGTTGSAVAGSMLGLQNLQEGLLCWQHTVITLERVECWVLPFADMAAILHSNEKARDARGSSITKRLQKQLEIFMGQDRAL